MSKKLIVSFCLLSCLMATAAVWLFAKAEQYDRLIKQLEAEEIKAAHKLKLSSNFYPNAGFEVRLNLDLNGDGKRDVAHTKLCELFSDKYQSDCILFFGEDPDQTRFWAFFPPSFGQPPQPMEYEGAIEGPMLIEEPIHSPSPDPWGCSDIY